MMGIVVDLTGPFVTALAIGTATDPQLATVRF
jgi:hypothetical protein